MYMCDSSMDLASYIYIYNFRIEVWNSFISFTYDVIVNVLASILVDLGFELQCGQSQSL
jgi:hypothetical protein